ncbi:lysosomal amino acid transporter 1 homolog, partial [Patella vulgata]|uniref:lysosomal amino acid transporter 1 homolog n=1 Tax=Patella vulgata TaxID=6465 RepID=UPI0024A8C986
TWIHRSLDVVWNTIYVAVWYVTADLVLLSQYIAYRYQKRRLALDVKNKNIQAVLCLGGLFLMGSLKSLQQLSPLDNSFSVHHPSGRNLLMTPQVGHIHMFKNNVELTGYIIGAISAVFYIGSRLSQIYTNYSRSSTEGLAKIMFWLAVLGNLLYGLAIIVRDIDAVFILQHLPWIIGSLGVIFLDVTLLCQFYYYERRNFNSLSRQPLLPEESSSSPIYVDSG